MQILFEGSQPKQVSDLSPKQPARTMTSDIFASHSTERLDGPSDYLLRKAVCMILQLSSSSFFS